MASTTLQIRVDDSIKNEAEEIFRLVGLNMSTAVRLFLNRVIIERGLPFPMQVAEKEKKSVDKLSDFDPVAFLTKYAG